MMSKLKKHKRLEQQVKLGLVGNYYWWRRYTEHEQFIGRHMPLVLWLLLT